MGESSPLIVETASGPVKGVLKTTTLGRDYVSFQGIPYMKPPVGSLRFRDPQPANSWIEAFDASNEPPSYCFYHPTANLKGGQEDAGVINVYVPVNSSSDLLPVMAYIYGGGFQMGSSKTDFYGPDYFLQKDVVLVTFNYRLGPIGFLSIKDPSLSVPGNAGLKDQLLALKWIQKNIMKFGGDNENVTLFGDSAGGASTHYHMISDQSEGLFHKAILMSGCSFNTTWSLVPPKDFAQRLGKKVGWDGTGGERKLLETLEAADPHELMHHSAPNSILTDEEFAEFRIFAFCPVVEPYLTPTTFIDKDPISMAMEAWSKNINCIVGGNSAEGAFTTIFERKEKFMETFERTNYFAPLVELGISVNDDNAARFGTRIKKIYFEYAHCTSTNYELFCQYSSDRHFWNGLQNVVKSRVISEGCGKTYLYRFDAETDLNVLKTFNKVENISGATHGDTMFYLFSSIYIPLPEMRSKELQMIKTMVDLWTNFASTGNPNCGDINDWREVTSIKPPLNCLNISDKKVCSISLPESDRLMIWDTVYKDAKVQMY